MICKLVVYGLTTTPVFCRNTNLLHIIFYLELQVVVPDQQMRQSRLMQSVILFQPYVAQSRENKKRYETAMLAWEKEMITEGRPELVRGYKPPKPAKKTAKKSAKKIAQSTKKITKKKTSSSPKKKSKSTQTEDEDTTWMREE